MRNEKYSQSRNIAEYGIIDFPYLKGLLLKAEFTPLSLMSSGMLLKESLICVYIFQSVYALDKQSYENMFYQITDGTFEQSYQTNYLSGGPN